MGPQVEALPTLVSYPGSRAYREGAAGVLHLRGTSRLDPSSYTEPCPDERERILGFRTGTTRAPGVTEATLSAHRAMHGLARGTGGGC